MRHRSRSKPPCRRGASLIIVMLVLSTAIVTAIAFLHAQSAALTAVGNEKESNLARKAAETGVAAALDAMQNSAWTGVTEILAAEVGRNEEGSWSYQATFEAVASTSTASDTAAAKEAKSAAAALQARIRSKGQWQAFNSSRPVEREIVVIARLTPRLSGRPSRPGDVATASDRGPDVAGFDQALPYGLFASDLTDSFFARPQTRIAGDIWLGGKLSLFQNLNFNTSSTQRADLLTGIGTDYGGGPGAPSPHPFAGAMTFYTAPDAAQQSDLTQLNVPATTTSTQLALPAFDPVRFQRYRLFAGGFEYGAEPVGSTLQNVSLGPTDSNPLGIFYCNGSVSVRDNVVIRGTLVATTGIAFEGRGITITAFDWRDGAGGTPVLDRDLWPVLPAVVSGGHVTATSASRVFIEGTVLTSQDLVIYTPDYSEEGALLDYTGTATAAPLGGGLSEVRVADVLSLSGLTIDSRHMVRLNGAAGRWHPVVSADTITGVFKVHGTADFSSAVACEFRPRQLYDADIAGPVIVRRTIFENPLAWSGLTSTTWDSKHKAWQDECALNETLLLPTRTFVAYLADPLNWPLAGNPYETYGLRLDPTVRVTRPPNVNYACEPPLFRADPSPRADGGGYRWEVVSWQETTP